MPTGKLSIVATPIGNLEDVTLRALRVLREADLVLAEDTRRTRKLCQRHDVGTRLESFHAHSTDSHVNRFVAELLAGKHVALVTDAGTPLVSDPGARLVAASTEAGVQVETVPGPSAVTAALTVAGIRCDSFRFVGFPPRSGKRRASLLREVAAERGATVLFEAPTRLGGTLAELAEVLGTERRVAVCRELTKVHEEVVRGTAADLAQRFAAGARGEVTLVVEGTGLDAGRVEALDDASIDAWIDDGLREGLRAGELARAIASETQLSRSEAYRRVVTRSPARDGDDSDE